MTEENERKVYSILSHNKISLVKREFIMAELLPLIDEQVKKALEEVEKSLNFCYTEGNEPYVNGHNDGIKEQSIKTQEAINKLNIKK